MQSRRLAEVPGRAGRQAGREAARGTQLRGGSAVPEAGSGAAAVKRSVFWGLKQRYSRWRGAFHKGV